MEGQRIFNIFGAAPEPAAHVSTEAAHVSTEEGAHVSSGLTQVSSDVGAEHVSGGGDGAQVSTGLAQFSADAVAGAHVSGGGAGAQVSGGKKKRGRPRKYGPAGMDMPGQQAAAISPMPISASIPLAGGGFPAWKPGRGRSFGSFKKKHKFFEFDSPGNSHLSQGEQVPYSVEANFTPHVITVNAGEDVNMKIISFSQQGSRAICVLSANGSVSNVTLRHPDSSGGTLTYEGRFEILSLTGSFTPTDTGGTKSRSGGMSVSLAGPDGSVYGGGLAGLLVATGPVQVVIGSFSAGHQQEQKPQKQRFEHNTTIYAPSPLNHHSAEAIDGSYGGHHTVTPNSIHISNHLSSENVISFGGSESNETNGPQKYDISC